MFNREVYGCGMLMDIANQGITAHLILIMGGANVFHNRERAPFLII